MVDRWFSPSTLVSSTNKTDPHDITKILLKVALKTLNQPNQKQEIENVYNLKITIDHTPTLHTIYKTKVYIAEIFLP